MAADQQADHADLHETEVMDRDLLVARGVHALVRLAGAERDGQWQAVAVSDEVQVVNPPRLRPKAWSA